MKNIEFYKDKLLACSNLSEAAKFAKEHGLDSDYCYTHGQSFCSWLYEDVSIMLSEKEKEFLSKTISPYKKHILTIKKVPSDEDESIYEIICYAYVCYDMTCYAPVSIHIPLSGFEKGWLKNIEVNREYTLEELGLYEY